MVERYLPLSVSLKPKKIGPLKKIAIEECMHIKTVFSKNNLQVAIRPKKESFSTKLSDSFLLKTELIQKQEMEALQKERPFSEENLIASSFLEDLKKETLPFSVSKIDTIKSAPIFRSPKEKEPSFFLSNPGKEKEEKKHLAFSIEFERKKPSFSSSQKPCLVSDTEAVSGGGFSLSIPTPSPKEIPQFYEGSFPSIPNLQDLNTLSCEDFFDIEVITLPDKEETIFAATLIPKSNEILTPLSQNFYFLLDTSNVIQNDRLKASKKAIHRTLSFLGEKDSFNIIHYDSKMQRMALHSVPCNKNERLFAKDFLHSLKLGSIFASADPFKPLNTLLFEKTAPEKVSHIFLITSGEGISNQNKVPFFIHDWTSKNQGKFCLHILALHSDPNLPLLDAFASLNQGKLYLASNKTGLKRKLHKMVKSVQSPIAKNLSIQAISSSNEPILEIYPSNQSLPILFQNEPFVIWGKVKKGEDFTLFIQGKNRETWLNLKKKISLQNAKKASAAFKEKWATQKAYSLYESYFKTDDPSYLIEANELLKPYQASIFE